MYSARKSSNDPRSSSNRNDIFGNSYGLKMHQHTDNSNIMKKESAVEDPEEVKKGTPLPSKPRGMLPITKNKDN